MNCNYKDYKQEFNRIVDMNIKSLEQCYNNINTKIVEEYNNAYKSYKEIKDKYISMLDTLTKKEQNLLSEKRNLNEQKKLEEEKFNYRAADKLLKEIEELDNKLNINSSRIRAMKSVLQNGNGELKEAAKILKDITEKYSLNIRQVKHQLLDDGRKFNMEVQQHLFNLSKCNGDLYLLESNMEIVMEEVTSYDK